MRRFGGRSRFARGARVRAWASGSERGSRRPGLPLGVAVAPEATVASGVVSSDIGSFSHDALASRTGANASAASGSSRAPPRSIHWDVLSDAVLGEADADERVEGVEDLTGSGTAGLRQQGELEHGRVAVVTDLDVAERGTEIVHALLALPGAGHHAARRTPARATQPCRALHPGRAGRGRRRPRPGTGLR